MLLDRGLLGLAVLALTWVAWRIFRLYAEVQEKRIAESREAVAALVKSAEALDAMADLIRDRRTGA